MTAPQAAPRLPDSLFEVPRWHHPAAACLGEPLEFFFPVDGMARAERDALVAKGLDICARCIVRQECLDAADAEEGVRGVRYGTKGGLLPEERQRRAMARARRTTARGR